MKMLEFRLKCYSRLLWCNWHWVIIGSALNKGQAIILTHWGPVTHICVVKLTNIGSDNGLSPGWRQAINWTNAGILLIPPLGTNFSEILIGIQTFSFKKINLKMLSAKWRPFCLGLNVLTSDSIFYSNINQSFSLNVIRVNNFINTLRLRQNGRQIPDDNVKCIFMNENI